MFDTSIQSLAVAEGQIARSSGSTEDYRILAWREGQAHLGAQLHIG